MKARGKSHSDWLVSKVENFSKIVASKQYWGMAEGSVYAILRGRGWPMIDCKKIDPGWIIWGGQARELFKPHPGCLFVANFKRLLRQYKAPSGNIEILASRRIGKALYVTRARVVPHQGQSKWLAQARLYLRGTIELVVASSLLLLVAAMLPSDTCRVFRWETGIFFVIGLLGVAAAGVLIVAERHRGRFASPAAIIGGGFAFALCIALVLLWAGYPWAFPPCFPL